MSEPSTPAAPAARRGWLAGVLTLVLLVGFGVLLDAPSAPTALPQTSAATFLPADATRGAVTLHLGSDEVPAELSDARLPAAAARDAFPTTAYDAIDSAVRSDAGSGWFREDVVPTRGAVPPRFRLRRVDDRGVWLVAQDWGDLGLSLDDMLELPAGVAAGQRWTSAGTARARPSDGPLQFTRASTASVPSDPGRAAEGCLLVGSRTDFSAAVVPSWTESDLWCPGKGVVAGDGTLRGSDFAVVSGSVPSPVTDADLARAPWDTTSVGTWRLRPETVLAGDQTTGLVDASATGGPTPGQAPVVSASGVVVFPTLEGGDLAALEEHGADLWAHSWVRPGGRVTSLATVGSLVVAPTTAHRVSAYRAGRTLVWNAPLSDVAVAPPLPVDDAVAVATVSGTLSLLAGRTGSVRWTTSVGRGVHDPLAAGDGVLVTADTRSSVTAWDLASGRRVWQVDDAASPFGTTLLVAQGQVVVATGASVTTYAVGDGHQTWTRAADLGLGPVVAVGDELRVGTGRDLQAWSVVDGTTRWTLPGAQPLPTAGACEPATGGLLGLARQGDRLVAVDGAGVARGSWALPVSRDEVLTASCRGAGVDLTAYAADGSAPLTVFRLAAA